MRRGVLALAVAIGLAIGSAVPTAAVGPAQDNLIWVNIALNVHQRDDLSFYGPLTETIPANQSCTSSSGTFAVGESHFSSTPVCAVIAAPTAYVTSYVTKTSGQTAFPADQSGSVNSPGYVHFGFQDKGSPSTTTDLLNGPPATGTGEQTAACTPGDPLPAFDLV